MNYDCSKKNVGFHIIINLYIMLRSQKKQRTWVANTSSYGNTLENGKMSNACFI